MQSAIVISKTISTLPFRQRENYTRGAMRVFRIPINYIVSGYINYEAESLADAVKGLEELKGRLSLLDIRSPVIDVELFIDDEDVDTDGDGDGGGHHDGHE